MVLIESIKPTALKRICFMAALALVTLPVLDSAALAKGKQIAHSARRSHSYFVPPPPAYTPSYVPELQRQVSSETLVANEGADQLVANEGADKYVRAQDGYQDPKAVHANKYVTYWNQK
jgi:hypothetical protein